MLRNQFTMLRKQRFQRSVNWILLQKRVVLEQKHLGETQNPVV
jgi:hypothetical protein